MNMEVNKTIGTVCDCYEYVHLEAYYDAMIDVYCDIDYI